MKTNAIGRLREQGYEQFYWSGRDGTFNDLSRKYTLTNTGVQNAKTERGYGGYFNGASYLTISGLSLGFVVTDTLSFAYWVKIRELTIGTPQSFLSFYDKNIPNGAWLGLQAVDNRFAVENYQSAGNVSMRLSDAVPISGRWYFLSGYILSSGAIPSLFVDCAPQTLSSSLGVVNQLNLGGATVRIGCQSNPIERYGRCYMDSVLVWKNYVLTNTDVAQIMAETRPWG